MNVANQKSGLLFAARLVSVAAFAVIFFGLTIAPANAATQWHIRDDATGGDCYLIGSWSVENKTCTLLQNVDGTIIIDDNYITLDGKGYSLTQTTRSSLYGVNITQKENVIIKNITVTNFSYGISLANAKETTLIHNTVKDNGCGIYVIRSFYTSYSHFNTVKDNIVTNNFYGICIISTGDSDFTGNLISNNSYGFYISSSARNTFYNNTIRSNLYGVYFYHDSNLEKFYNNNFQGNSVQMQTKGVGNIFNLNLPIGGNYWDDFDEPSESCNDLNNDNFCDSPYVFSGGQDNLPWTKKDGWLVPKSPDISINPDSISFFNDEGPFASNTIKVSVEVSNKGGVAAESVSVSLLRNDILIGTTELGKLDPAQKRIATFKVVADANLENSNLRVEALAGGQDDANNTDNILTKPIDFYFINFGHNEDAFWFGNWGYDNLDDYKEDFINFLSSQWHEGDIVTIIATSLIDPLANLIGLQGHCYGMSASSMAYYLWPDVKPVDKSTFLMEEQEVKPDIIERQWEQLLHIYPALITAWDILLPYDATAEYEKILHYIKDLQEPVGLALREKGGNGGHEVVAYKVLDLGENEKRVYIYDNNYPLYLKRQDQYVLFKPMSNEANYNGGGYEYDRAFTTEPWKTIGTEELLSIIKTAFSKVIDKLWQQDVISLNIFSPVSPFITDNLGRSVGYKNGEFINEIPGASINEQLGAYFIYLPKDFIYTAELTGTDDGIVGIDVITPISNTEANIQNFKNIPISRLLVITVNLDGSNRVVKDAQGDIVEPYLKQTINSDKLEVLLRLSELRKIITNLNIIQGVKTSLITKIDSTIEALKRGNTKRAINQLNALANNITAQTGKHITNEDADKLISAVEEIKEMVLYFKM